MKRIYKQPIKVLKLLLFLFFINFVYISFAYVYWDANIIKWILIMITVSEFAYLGTMLEEIEDNENDN